MEGVVLGISSHSCPVITSFFKKKGHSLTKRLSDSSASATEMGTGEDLITAAATSDAGKVRRLRAPVMPEEFAGFENNL